MTTLRNALLIGIITLFAFSCGQGDQATTSGDAEPIKVGAIFAVTGPASFLGEPEKNTAMMIVDKVNEAGGINGRMIELIVEDSEGDDTKAVIAANKLIKRENVCAIIGPSRSGTTMAVIEIMEENEIPLISCAAAEAIVNPVKQWVFKTPQKDSDCVIRIFEDMKSKNINKIAIITGTTGFGKAGRDQLKKIAPDMGMEIVSDETYAPTDTDMTAQLTHIRGTDAQAIVNWSIVAAQSIVPKNMKQLNMTVPLYQSHGFGNIKFVEAAGDAANGILFPAGALLAAETLPDSHPRKQMLVDYQTDYQTNFGGVASTFGGHAYDAMYMVVDALKAVGDDPEMIRGHIEQLQGFHGTAGTFNMSPTDHNGLNKDAFEMIQVKDGKFVLYQP
ncbi:MAG: ABC transporter substrate-binding protein [Candidatus Hinthialibacter antarcticus]|nr:ABC transporter substrate-binding protein [Candidatus Hinthialibacter antarcticus]